MNKRYTNSKYIVENTVANEYDKKEEEQIVLNLKMCSNKSGNEARDGEKIVRLT